MSDFVKPNGEGKAHPQLVQAARLVAQARAIHDEFKSDPSTMPAEAAQQVKTLLGKASDLREAVERESQIKQLSDFLSEPQHKHAPLDGSAPEGKGGFGGFGMVDEQRQKAHAKSMFLQWVRKGDAALAPEQKADLVENTTGEILVPEDVMGPIFKELPRQAVVRGQAFVRPTTSNRIRVTSLTEGNVAWGKLETGAGTTLTDGEATPTPAEEYIYVRNLYGLAKVGVDELEDTDDNLEAIIQEMVTAQFAEAEDDAFANGSAADEPSGIAQGYDTNQVVTGTENTVDATELKRLKYQVKSQFRRNGAYYAHSDVEEQAALLTDTNGQFLWQPSVAADEPATFSGKRWFTLDGLPGTSTTAADASGNGQDPACIFGDLRQAYAIADRRRITVQRLNEKYADEGKVGLLFTHRVGGGVIRPKALAAYLL